MKKMKWIIGLTMLISPAVMADISLNFKHTANASGYCGFWHNDHVRLFGQRIRRCNT